MESSMQDLWDNALTLHGKTQLLRKFEFHPGLAVRKFTDLPELVRHVLCKDDRAIINHFVDTARTR